MKRILCICHNNQCLSPMFEALLQQAIDEAGQNRNIYIESAGTLQSETLLPASEGAVACMREVGLNLRNHHSRWFGSLDLAEYDLVLCMDPDVLQTFANFISNTASVFEGKVELINPPQGLRSPFGKRPSAYKKCAETLTLAARNMVGQLEM